MPPTMRLGARARLAWHIVDSLKDFWSSDLNRATVELVDPQQGQVVVDTLLELFRSAGLTDPTSTYRTLAATPATVITTSKPA
ncbi:MAG: hypothetical protein WA991_03220 [Ornithinimicrobium sp.]